MKNLLRINKICEYIKPYKSIADIGCDHGYLIKSAIENYNINNAYAIDNKIGPLNKAKDNLNKYSQVKFFLSNGIECVDSSIEVIVIAGMGGNLINDIILKNIDKLKCIKRLIIQANKDEYIIRNTLYKHGFKIINEDIIEEDDIIYEIDVFELNNDKISYSDDELYFGPFFLKNKTDLFIKKWQKKYNKYKLIEVYNKDEEKKKIMEGIKKILCK